MHCSKCGFQNRDGVEICGGCGARLNVAPQPQRIYGSQSGNAYPPVQNRGYQQNSQMRYPQGYQMANGNRPGKGTAIASLVLGIVSIVCWFLLMFSFIGVITGIVGIVCSVLSKKAGYRGGLQTAGLVLSIIGTAISAIVFVACLSCAAAYGGMYGLLDSIF